MIIETITVTATPTSLLALIATARGGPLEGSQRVGAMQLALPSDATATILAEDANTTSAIPLLVPSEQPYESNLAFKLDEMLLSATSDQVVYVLASQAGKSY